MKKLLNISVIAALAILPLAANAEVVAGEPTSISDPGLSPAQEADSVTASGSPKYALAVSGTNDDKVATAGYVKGAYNSAIKAINKVSETASNALTASSTATLTNKTIDANGTGNNITNLEKDNFASGAVVDSTTGIQAAATASDDKFVTEKAVASAIVSDAVQTVTAGTVNGTISVDGGADVTIYDDSTLAGRVTANEDKIGNTTLTTTAQTLTGAIEEVKGTAGFAGTASELTDTHFQAADKTSASKAANAAMAAAAAAQADVDAVETDLSTNYATRTGAAATAAAAVNGATVTYDLSGLGVSTGAVGGTATIPAVATWGTDALAANPISVDLTQTSAVTGLTGNTPSHTASISAGTVTYTAGN